MQMTRNITPKTCTDLAAPASNSILAGIDQTSHMSVIIFDHITKNPAIGNPFLVTELAQCYARPNIALFVGFGRYFLPLGKIRQIFFQFRAAYLAQEYRHVLGEKSLVCIIEIQQPNFIRKARDRSANIDRSTDHSYAGSVADNGR